MSFRISTLLLVCAVILCTTTSSYAALSFVSVVGGMPVGADTYVNFDSLPLGAAGGSSGGVGVSFGPDGQAVQGAASGLYAAPFISNSNGALFGDATVSGADATTYLTTGVGSVTLTLPGNEMYLGLLWGSVDSYNTLQFYNSSNVLVGTATGTDVTNAANGDQGVNGTYYVNINSSVAFTTVVALSSVYAFEFDNVAFNDRPFSGAVPESSSLTVWSLLGAFGAAAMLISKKPAVKLGL
jgi:hypothetical protein